MSRVIVLHNNISIFNHGIVLSSTLTVQRCIEATNGKSRFGNICKSEIYTSLEIHARVCNIFLTSCLDLKVLNSQIDLDLFRHSVTCGSA